MPTEFSARGFVSAGIKRVILPRYAGASRIFSGHGRTCIRWPNWLESEERTLAMNFAICNEIFREWKIEDIFAYASKLGYNGVEIAPFTLANSVVDIGLPERRRIRESAAKSNIGIAGIHWVLVKPEGMYINHPDAAIRQRTARHW